MVNRILCSVVVLTALAGSAVPASAQTHLGLRAGVSGGPDQFVFGFHVDTPPLLEHFTFRPNVEIGVGDDQTLAGLNVEFAYWVPIPDTRWQVYFAGGPAVNITSDDRNGNDDTSVEGGFNLGVGVQHGRGFFSELKVGFAGSPDLKFLVGYVF